MMKEYHVRGWRALEECGTERQRNRGTAKRNIGREEHRVMAVLWEEQGRSGSLARSQRERRRNRTDLMTSTAPVQLL